MPVLEKVMSKTALEIALAFHEAYERLAPSFGYATRADTRAFDANSANGKLMTAVCEEMRLQAFNDAYAAIRKHRDFRGDDRCWMDDVELYQSLPEGYEPPKADASVELKNCERYISCRHNPATKYESPERVIEKLLAIVAAADAYIFELQTNSGQDETDRESRKAAWLAWMEAKGAEAEKNA